MERMVKSPIKKTLDKWPLAGTYTLRWGKDSEGAMWVAVENRTGDCQYALPYQEYLDMEEFRPEKL